MALHLVFGDFELDEARFELRRRGAVVSLQPKVMALILYLAHRRDRVVTKTELFEEVWKGTLVTEASLSQAVSLARRALDDTPEKQWAIRTVRRIGLQFVAHVGPSRSRATRQADAVRAPAASVATTMETLQARPSTTTAPDEPQPCLTLALNGDAPTGGGASWSLADVDEVCIGRGAERKSHMEAGTTSVLRIAVPSRQISRSHANIVKTPSDWFVVDEGSRNGTFVNGERVHKRALAVGDLIQCGGAFFFFDLAEPHELDLAASSDDDNLLATVLPRLASIDRDLRRVAKANVPIIVLGEIGVGKTHLAERIHQASGRSGPSISIDAASPTLDASVRDLLVGAAAGTVVLENIDRIAADSAMILAGALEATPRIRVVATALSAIAEVEARVPAALLSRCGGYRVELPPLRDRRGDLGSLLATMVAPETKIDTAAGLALLRHEWPGNVRELQHVIGAALALSNRGTITAQHLPGAMKATAK